MSYSVENKRQFLSILVSKDFDIKNTTIEFNNKNNTTLERSTVYDWIKNDELFKKEYDTLRNELLDESEKMHQLLRRGIPIYNEETKEIIAWQEKPDRQAIEFFLKNKGVDRGYIDKSNIEHSGEIKTKTTIIVQDNETAEILNTMVNDNNKSI